MCGEIRDCVKRERDICVRPIIPTEPKYDLRVESLLKTWSRTSMANAKQSGLAITYIHKPTVLKNKRRAKNFYFSNCQGRSLLLLIMKVSDFLVLQV